MDLMICSELYKGIAKIINLSISLIWKWNKILEKLVEGPIYEEWVSLPALFSILFFLVK